MGLIFTLTEPDGSGPWLHVFAVSPGAYDQPKARRTIRELAKHGNIAGVEIMLYGQIGIVVFTSDLDSMEQLVEEYRD